MSDGHNHGGGAANTSTRGDTFTDKVKPKHVRASNIAAAKCAAVAPKIAHIHGCSRCGRCAHEPGPARDGQDGAERERRGDDHQ